MSQFKKQHADQTKDRQTKAAPGSGFTVERQQPNISKKQDSQTTATKATTPATGKRAPDRH